MYSILREWWPFIGAAAALIIATIIAVKYKIPLIQGRLGKLEKVSHKQDVKRMDLMDTVKKNELYKDGQPIYQLASACKDSQRICQTRVCAKVDEVKTQVTELRTSLKEVSVADQESREKIAVIMTRVEDFMLLDRTKELKTFAKIIVNEIKDT